MKKAFIILFTLLVCCSCGSTKVATQIVRESSVDTVYLSNVQYDSVYVFKDHLTDRSRDTIYIRDVQYEYKYKFLRDTIYRVQMDTIPIIREVEVVKTERYVPGIYKWSLGILIVIIIVIVISILWKIKF